MTIDKQLPVTDLIERIANGDQKAEVELINGFRLREKIKFIVDVRLSATAADKEDIVSDIIMALLLNLRRGYYNPAKSAFLTYVWAISANKVRDYLRPGASRRRANDLLTEQHLAQIDETMEHRERNLHLRKTVKSLSPKYRDVIMMRYFEELTIEEMSSRLNLTESQTYNRIHYALALIRRKGKNV